MATEETYSIKLPKTEALFLDNRLSFSIDHIRSRETSTLYFVVKFYDMHDTLLYTYTSKRWVIDTIYSTRYRNFTIPSDVADDTAKFEITLYAVGITSENPLYFVGLMFQEGDYSDYHTVSERITDAKIGFVKSSYANLYNGDGSYLQVIRPSRADMHTSKLDACACTVLAPHLAEENVFDDPLNIFLEFTNQSDQRIDVLR